MRSHEQGARLRLRVKPGARRSGLLGVHGGALKVAVPQAPEKGRANRSVLEVLAKALGLPAAALRLLAGEASRDKAVFIPLSPREVAARLGELPDGPPRSGAAPADGSSAR